MGCLIVKAFKGFLCGTLLYDLNCCLHLTLQLRLDHLKRWTYWAEEGLCAHHVDRYTNRSQPQAVSCLEARSTSRSKCSANSKSTAGKNQRRASWALKPYRA
eukprot:4397848-Amphidinium_carterae.1